MKQRIKLSESTLHRIIKESVNKMLNEAYGTPTNQDKATMWNLNNTKDGSLSGFDSESMRHLSSDEIRDRAYNFNDNNTDKRMPDEIRLLLQLSDFVKDVLYDPDYFKFIDKNISALLFKNLRAVNKCCDMLINKSKMNLGQQPDANYFERH